MNKHYVCTGKCEGVSGVEGSCQAVSCEKHGLPLVECNCVDELHVSVLKKCKNCGKICNNNCDIDLYKEEIN